MHALPLVRRGAVLAGLLAPSLASAAPQQEFVERNIKDYVPVDHMDSSYRPALLFADVDGDGAPDLLEGRGSISFRPAGLLRNDGTGRFTAVAGKWPATGTTALAAADLDGDGDQDVAAHDLYDLSLFTNDGTGTFTASSLFSAPSPLEGITAADVDGDGAPELLVGYDLQVLQFGNDGSGGFTNQSGRMPTSPGYDYGIEPADVDGDGDLDLFVANDSASLLLSNDGTGTFTDVTATQMPPRAPASRSPRPTWTATGTSTPCSGARPSSPVPPRPCS